MKRYIKKENIIYIILNLGAIYNILTVGDKKEKQETEKQGYRWALPFFYLQDRDQLLLESLWEREVCTISMFGFWDDI